MEATKYLNQKKPRKKDYKGKRKLMKGISKN